MLPEQWFEYPLYLVLLVAFAVQEMLREGVKRMKLLLGIMIVVVLFWIIEAIEQFVKWLDEQEYRNEQHD